MSRKDVILVEPQSATGTTRLGAAALIALTVGMSLGNAGGNVMPVLLDGFSAQFELSATMAGLIAAAQSLTAAIVALLVAGRAARPGRVRLVRIGLVIATAGFVCSWLAPVAGVVLGANVVAGLGLGLVFAGAAASLSATPDVDRATTLTVLFSTVLIAVLIVAVPLVNSLGGGTAGFAVLAGCSLAGLALVAGLPEVPSGVDITGRPRLKHSFLVAVGVFGVVEQGAWSYAALLARTDTGVDESQAAGVLAVAAAAGSLALGTGVGPAVIGALLDQGGSAGLAAGIAVLTAGAMLPIMRLMRVQPRHLRYR